MAPSKHLSASSAVAISIIQRSLLCAQGWAVSAVNRTQTAKAVHCSKARTAPSGRTPTTQGWSGVLDDSLDRIERYAGTSENLPYGFAEASGGFYYVQIPKLMRTMVPGA